MPFFFGFLATPNRIFKIVLDPFGPKDVLKRSMLAGYATPLGAKEIFDFWYDPMLGVHRTTLGRYGPKTDLNHFMTGGYIKPWGAKAIFIGFDTMFSWAAFFQAGR